MLQLGDPVCSLWVDSKTGALRPDRADRGKVVQMRHVEGVALVRFETDKILREYYYVSQKSIENPEQRVLLDSHLKEV